MQRLAASAQSDAGGKFQFERPGYYAVDRMDHAPGKPVSNLVVRLRDGSGK